jgi:hypothetical protein
VLPTVAGCDISRSMRRFAVDTPVPDLVERLLAERIALLDRG